jgi:hypothetical protein
MLSGSAALAFGRGLAQQQVFQFSHADAADRGHRKYRRIGEQRRRQQGFDLVTYFFNTSGIDTVGFGDHGCAAADTQQIKDLLAKPEYALFREPPPADDPRPMSDEFTYFDQVMKAEGKK